ncbi:hypothetical protein CR513_43562, partial [Mucuna pruriens]
MNCTSFIRKGPIQQVVIISQGYLTRASMLESNGATMTRFLHGINRDIQDIVELYHYAIMDD